MAPRLLAVAFLILALVVPLAAGQEQAASSGGEPAWHQLLRELPSRPAQPARDEAIVLERPPNMEPDYAVPAAAGDSASSSEGGGATGPATSTFPGLLYLYAWCGRAPGNTAYVQDYIAVIDATDTSPAFGKIVYVASSPYQDTQPHHCGVDASGRWLGAGGLLSFLQKEPTPDIMLWDLRIPAMPRYSHGLMAASGGCTDEFLPMPAGGFTITNMCNRTGGGGGGIARLGGSDMRRLREFGGGLRAGERSTLYSHGVDVDYQANRAVTSDFINIASTVKDASGHASPKLGKSVRVWELDTGKVLKTIWLRNMANGLMDVRRVPNSNGLFWATNGWGWWLLVDSLNYNKPVKMAYCLKGDAASGTCERVEGTCINSNTFAGGTRMLISTYTLDQVRLLDISDPTNLKTLDTYQMPNGAGGHVVKVVEAARIAAVSSYFVDQPGTIVRYESDRKVTLLYIDDADGGRMNRLVPITSVDFNTAVPQYGPSNCHGLAFNAVPRR